MDWTRSLLPDTWQSYALVGGLALAFYLISFFLLRHAGKSVIFSLLMSVPFAATFSIVSLLIYLRGDKEEKELIEDRKARPRGRLTDQF